MANLNVTLKNKKTNQKLYPRTYVKNVKSEDDSKDLEQLLEEKQDTLPTTTTSGKVLKSTSTAGTVEWGDESGGSTVTVSSTGVTDGTNTYNASDKLGKTETITALWVGTQAEYDAITTKNPTTLYFIKE